MLSDSFQQHALRTFQYDEKYMQLWTELILSSSTINLVHNCSSSLCVCVCVCVFVCLCLWEVHLPNNFLVAVLRSFCLGLQTCFTNPCYHTLEHFVISSICWFVHVIFLVCLSVCLSVYWYDMDVSYDWDKINVCMYFSCFSVSSPVVE